MAEVEISAAVVGPVGDFVQGYILTPDTKEGRKGKAAQFADDNYKATVRYLDDDGLKEFKREALRLFKNLLPGADKAAQRLMLDTLFKNGDKLADKAARKAASTGVEKAKKEWARGYVVVNCKSKYAPEAIDRAGVNVENRQRFYPGARVAIEYTLKAHVGNDMDPDDRSYIAPGVAAYFNNIILLDEKTPKIAGVGGGGGRSAREAFKNLTGGTSTECLDEDDDEDADDLI